MDKSSLASYTITKADTITPTNRVAVEEVPDEILTEIFLLVPRSSRWTVQSFHGPLDPLTRVRRPCSLKRSPFSLAHVCRRWREIVVTTPGLWNYLPLINLEASKLAEPDANPFLQTYLTLSKNSPLSIFAAARKHASQEIFNFLAQKAEHWKDVTLFLLGPRSLDFEGIRGRLNCLRVLVIILNGDISFPLDLFADAPVLEELTFILPQKCPGKLPSSLKKYHGTYPGTIRAHTLLASSPQLEICRFDAVRRWVWEPDSLTINSFPEQDFEVFMPNLHTLALRDCLESGYPITPVLDRLKCPRLRNLELDLKAIGHDPQYPQVATLLQRSRCSLRVLSLSFDNLTYPSPGSLQTLLQMTPDLELFMWKSEPVPLDVNTILTIMDDRALLPHLKSLVFDTWGICNQKVLNPKVIRKVLQMRAPRYQGPENNTSPSQTSGSLTYLCLKRSDVDEEVQAELTGWSKEQDAHIDALLLCRQRLITNFESPTYMRSSDAIRSSMSYIVNNYRRFDIRAVLSSGIHLILLKLILRGHSLGFEDVFRVEYSWIERIVPVIERWKIKTKEYLKTPCWFVSGDHLYWIADDQDDVYEHFWTVRPPTDHPFYSCKQPPSMQFVDTTRPVFGPPPDWEYAELPPYAYSKAPNLILKFEELGI